MATLRLRLFACRANWFRSNGPLIRVMMEAAPSDWTPNPSILNGIVDLLKQADSSDSHVQRKLAEAVTQLATLVDAPCYYCFILVDCADQSAEIRQRAGLLLKSRISELIQRIGRQSPWSETAPPDHSQTNSIVEAECHVLEYAKVNAPRAILDPLRVVRATAGSILTTLVGHRGVEGYPRLLPFLFNLLDHPDSEICDGAYGAFSKIVEDEISRAATTGHMAAMALTEVEVSKSPSFLGFCAEKLVPKLLMVANTDNTPLSRRCISLACLNHFQQGHLFMPGESLGKFFSMYWETLGHLAMDGNPEIGRLVLAGMEQVITLSPDIVLNNLDSILIFTIQCLDPQKNAYENLHAALELFSHILKRKESHPTIEKALPTYTNWDYLQMDQNQLLDGNATAPDTAEDLAPVFRRTGGDDNDENYSEEDGNLTTWGSSWTARKSAARALDHLSTIFGNQILIHLLPSLGPCLHSEEWEVKESAILALGAIARGCIDGLNQYLPDILKVLLSNCSDRRPIVRSISLWTLSRFAMWICPQEDILKLTCSKLLSHIMDSNKRVQEAACSAFAALLEEAGQLLLPYLSDIVETLSTALRTFQTKNLLFLLDAIGTLADSLGSSIDCPDFKAKLLDPLMEKWQSTTDNILVVVFECLSCVARVLQEGISSYAPNIVHQCIEFIRKSINRLENDTEGETQQSDKELIECSADLLSSISEALRNDIAPLIENTDLFDLLHKCSEMNMIIVGSAVKQGTFALIGDLAQHAPHLISNKISILVPPMILYIADAPTSVCHNAAWAISQIALYASHNGELNPYCDKICEQLVRVMLAPYTYETLLRNTCITMGRLALVCPNNVATEMNAIFGLWCHTMTSAPNDLEKAVAFQGLCNIINLNQNLAVDHMPALLDAISSLYFIPTGTSVEPKIPSETHEMLHKIVSWLYTSKSIEWKASLSQIRPTSHSILQSLLSI